jgi:hypothetical protein
MLRALLRWTGCAALAGALALGIVDGARSISISGLSVTSLDGLLRWLAPARHEALGPAVAEALHPLLWDVLALVLRLPAVAALFAAGGALLLLGRRPAPPPLAAAPDAVQRTRSPG